MEIKADQETLVKAISAVLGVVDKKSTMPILGNVLIKTNGNGLEIGATDLELSYRGYCPAIIEKEGAVTVPAHQLNTLAKDLPAGDLEIKSTERYGLKIRAGKSKYQISGIDPNQFPPLPEKPMDGYVEMTASFLKEMIRKVIFSSSGDDMQYHLSSVFIEALQDEDTLRMVTTDGHRLTLIDREVPGPYLGLLNLGAGILVPRKAMLEILRFLDKEERVSLNMQNGVLSLVTGEGGNKLLAIRLLDKKFPEYRRIIPEAWIHRFTFNREELLTALKRVSLMVSGQFKGITLNLNGDTVTIEGRDDVGEGQEVFGFTPEWGEVENGPIDRLTVSYNSRYLIEPLAMMEGETVFLQINDVDRPARLSAFGDPRYFSIVMPMST